MQENNQKKVQFDEIQSQNLDLSENSKVVGFVMKYSQGFIKNEEQAYYTLLIFLVLIIIFSLYFILGDSSIDEGKIIPYIEVAGPTDLNF